MRHPSGAVVGIYDTAQWVSVRQPMAHACHVPVDVVISEDPGPLERLWDGVALEAQLRDRLVLLQLGVVPAEKQEFTRKSL